MVRITTSGEITKMRRQARSESAIKGVKTRGDRQLLRGLFALEDPRQSAAEYYPDDSVSFFERLYGLEDVRV